MEINSLFNIKSEPKYSYLHKIGNQNSYTYSEQRVNLIFEEIKKDNPRHVGMLK